MLKTDLPLALSPVWLEACVAAAGTPLRVRVHPDVGCVNAGANEELARQCLP